MLCAARSPAGTLEAANTQGVRLTAQAGLLAQRSCPRGGHSHSPRRQRQGQIAATCCRSPSHGPCREASAQASPITLIKRQGVHEAASVGGLCQEGSGFLCERNGGVLVRIVQQDTWSAAASSRGFCSTLELRQLRSALHLPIYQSSPRCYQ